MEILAREHGIVPGESVGKALNALLASLSGDSEETKELVLENGTYYIDSEDAIYTHELRITNTIGEREWRKGEDIQGKKIAIFIEGVRHLRIIGNGARFVLRGVMTNMAIIDSVDVIIEDIRIDTERPNLHSITITDVRTLYFDFRIDKDSEYERVGSRYYFVGKDYRLGFFEDRNRCWWSGKVAPDTPDTIVRSAHPLVGVWRIKELSKGVFRAYTPLAKSKKEGYIYHIFDTRRKNVGIFIDSSKDITLRGVCQTFNYSLAIVAESTENITLEGLRLMPSEDTELKMISICDFIHLCMCRGDIKVTGGEFVGAADDCLNVHGIHFEIVEKRTDSIVVRFMHPQAYGFLPIREGDVIEYVDKRSLLAKGNAKVTSATMIDEYNIALGLDDVALANVGDVIEDISACPSLTFEDNHMTRIITRGILVTTRGAVVIRNNDFGSCSMHSILFSDDANSWYESGRVENVLIEGNTFGYTPMYNIYIKPENIEHKGYVHGEFVVRGNKFFSAPNGGIYAKSTRRIVLQDNVVSDGTLRVDTENVGELAR